jgi:hypothetical protein
MSERVAASIMRQRIVRHHRRIPQVGVDRGPRCGTGYRILRCRQATVVHVTTRGAIGRRGKPGHDCGIARMGAATGCARGPRSPGLAGGTVGPGWRGQDRQDQRRQGQQCQGRRREGQQRTQSGDRGPKQFTRHPYSSGFRIERPGPVPKRVTCRRFGLVSWFSGGFLVVFRFVPFSWIIPN